MKSRALHANWGINYAHGLIDKKSDNKEIVGTENKITEGMVDLTGTRTEEILNKGANSPRMETRARAPLTGRQTAIEEVKCWTCGKLGHYNLTITQMVLNLLSRQRWSE